MNYFCCFVCRFKNNPYICRIFETDQILKARKMKTTEEIKSEELSQELTNRGIENHFSVSSTDFGTSCYFTFYKNEADKYVVRISDHSVENTTRVFNERHERAEKINIEKVANAIELYLFPERFEFVACKEGFTHRVNGIFGKYTRK